MDGVGLADGSCADLAQTYTANLALLDHFGQCFDGGLNGDFGIAARAFEDVDGLGVAEYFKSFLDRCSDTLWTAVRASLHVVGAFDAEDDLFGVFGVFFKVVFEQMQ